MRCSYCKRPIPEDGEGTRVTSTGLVVCERSSCYRLYAISEARRAMDLPEVGDASVTSQPTVSQAADQVNENILKYHREADQ